LLRCSSDYEIHRHRGCPNYINEQIIDQENWRKYFQENAIRAYKERKEIRQEEIREDDEMKALIYGIPVEEIRRKREAKEQRNRVRTQEELDGQHGSLRRTAARISYRLSRSRRRKEEIDNDWEERVRARLEKARVAEEKRLTRVEEERLAREAERQKNRDSMHRSLCLVRREKKHMQTYLDAYDLERQQESEKSRGILASSLYRMVVGESPKQSYDMWSETRRSETDRDRAIIRELDRWRQLEWKRMREAQISGNYLYLEGDGF